MPLTELTATAFATLFVALGPVETALVFGALTAGVHRPERVRLAGKAVAVALIVLALFGVFGLATLGALHISLDAFRVAGGILLLMQATELIFAKRSGLNDLTPEETREAMGPGDIAVFPLAFPLIAGPASLTALVLLMGRTGGQPLGMAVVAGCMLACLALTYIGMLLTEPLQQVLKETGSNVIARLSGLLLAALAVQFIFDGVRGARLLG